MNLFDLDQASVLNGLIFFWIDEESVGLLDVAVCNHILRKYFFEILAVSPKKQYFLHDNYHRSFSKLYLRYKFCKTREFENELKSFGLSKLNWCISRRIQLTLLHIEKIDMACSTENSVDNIASRDVVCLSVEEQTVYPDDRDRIRNTFRAATLARIINRCPKLIALTVNNSSAVSGECFQQIDDSILAKLNKLSLEIKCCDNPAISTLFNQLAHKTGFLLLLKISDALCFRTKNKNAKNLALTALITLLSRNPLLEDLNLDLGTTLTSEILECVAKKCKNLKYVIFTFLQWTDYSHLSFIASIINNCVNLCDFKLQGHYTGCDIYYNDRLGLAMGYFDDNMIELKHDHIIGLFGNFHKSLYQIKMYGFNCLDNESLECIGQNHSRLQNFVTVMCGNKMFRTSNTPKMVLANYCSQAQVDTWEEDSISPKYTWATVCDDHLSNTHIPICLKM
jgi:hypothetical protein